MGHRRLGAFLGLARIFRRRLGVLWLPWGGILGRYRAFWGFLWSYLYFRSHFGSLGLSWGGILGRYRALGRRLGASLRLFRFFEAPRGSLKTFLGFSELFQVFLKLLGARLGFS